MRAAIDSHSHPTTGRELTALLSRRRATDDFVMSALSPAAVRVITEFESDRRNAIHRGAGPRLLEERRTLGGCPTGEAKITKGYNLPAIFVIHTVGPVWRDGRHSEDEFLTNCYRNSLALAAQHSIKSIAFPSISTGAYRFPIERAADIALNTTLIFFDPTRHPHESSSCASPRPMPRFTRPFCEDFPSRNSSRRPTASQQRTNGRGQ